MVREGLVSLDFGELRRLATGDDSSSPHDDDDVWTELSDADYVHLGITVAYQVLVVVVVAHLWLCRTWPPYIPRQISLVCLTGLAGVVAYWGALIAYGVVEREEGDILAQCGVEGLFDYYGWGLWTSVALVRVYRSWKILVRHTVDMWPAWRQVLLISVPWLIPMLAYSIDPKLAGFDERGNWCHINTPLDTALYVYGCVPIVGAFFLVWQMRKVRKQMNFFKMQTLQLLFLLLTGTVIFPVLEGWLETRDDIRRTWIMYDNVVTSLILFWPPIAEPFYRYLRGDQSYLHTYTKGFSTLPTPSQMRSSLKNQLSLEDLRKEFEKFADARTARELPDFYKACLDREEIEDFFERQAVTTAILDRFIRLGGEQVVNLSDGIRSKILATEITSYNIFTDAMAEVLKIMDNNFSVEFHESKGYKTLEKVVEKEAEELERLRKMRQLPPKEHIKRDPIGLIKLIRRVSKSTDFRSVQDGTDSRVSDKTSSPGGRQRDMDLELCSLDDYYDEETPPVRAGDPAHSPRQRRPKGGRTVQEEWKSDGAARGHHLRAVALENGGSAAGTLELRHAQPVGFDRGPQGYYSGVQLSHQTPPPRDTENTTVQAPSAPSHRRREVHEAGVRFRVGAQAPGLPPLRPLEARRICDYGSPPVGLVGSHTVITLASSSSSRSGVGVDVAPMASELAPETEHLRGFPGDARGGPGRVTGAAIGGVSAIRYASRGESGSGSGSGSVGGGASFLSPAFTGRSSEESRSVSWCSDNYGSSDQFTSSSSGSSNDISSHEVGIE